MIGTAVAVGGPLSPALTSLGVATCLAAGILLLVRRREAAGASETGARESRVETTSPSPPGGVEDVFARAIGDAIAELYALRGRLEEAQNNERYEHGYGLPANERRAAANALEDQGLPQVRRAVDAAHNECDRLNRLLPARSWSAGPIPEALVPPVLPEDRLREALAKVDVAIRLLEAVNRDRRRLRPQT